MNPNELFLILQGDRVEIIKKYIPSLYTNNYFFPSIEIGNLEIFKFNPPIISIAVYFSSNKIVNYLISQGFGINIPDVFSLLLI